MVHRFLFRGYPFWLCVYAALGSIAPDWGHFLNLITKGQVGWDFAHGSSFWLWWVIASLAGFMATVLLRRGNGNRSKLGIP